MENKQGEDKSKVTPTKNHTMSRPTSSPAKRDRTPTSTPPKAPKEKDREKAGPSPISKKPSTLSPAKRKAELGSHENGPASDKKVVKKKPIDLNRAPGSQGKAKTPDGRSQSHGPSGIKKVPGSSSKKDIGSSSGHKAKIQGKIPFKPLQPKKVDAQGAAGAGSASSSAAKGEGDPKPATVKKRVKQTAVLSSKGDPRNGEGGGKKAGDTKDGKKGEGGNAAFGAKAGEKPKAPPKYRCR